MTPPSEPHPLGPAFDATVVAPHPSAAMAAWQRDEPLYASDDSAPMPLDLLLPSNDAEPTIGHVGRYALKHRLGEGGLGRVHAAWDPILSRSLAVKTIQLGAISPARDTLDALFLNEARAVAGLNHPHIVTVYDAGLSDHGVYIAMEHLPGCDMRQLLSAGWRPDPQRAARLARRVADALTYAHARGVIHCDIKPANIFMVDRRKPKVLDFGIARVAHGPGAPALDGVIAGSPHYLAPEQLRGESVDQRSDVYSLGVVLYELLTGRKAFDGPDLRAITDAVLFGPVPPAHELAPALPLGLSRIAARAMARRPEDRFATARELAAALRQWLAKAAEDSPPLVFAPQGADPTTAPLSRTRPAEVLAAPVAGASLPAGRPRRWLGWAALAVAAAALLAWQAAGGP
jgi:eukaryotic-like serine/threonine-protein kinase